MARNVGWGNHIMSIEKISAFLIITMVTDL